MRVTASIRIQWFHNELTRGSYPNAPRIAEFFGISTRQAQRDVDILKKQYGAPLAFDRKHGGYYYTAEFNLPVMVTSENDDIFKQVTQNPFASIESAADSLIIQSQIPYTATLEIKDKLTVLEMRSYIIASEKKSRFLCEFHNVDSFLCAIFAARSGITVVEPEWLKDRLFEMLAKVQKANPKE